ncbi:prepilin-type N-terminal cleavage/methylation domain-containing protein [Cerasicoccus fimbriatus]|uniref:prepilin-type N-terminal cleavage/methylation domain-containing protein n=1 Tax=Cerasicoccus fimbriatus TaxID=3014554 RepID=UPI0022B5D35D|nr:prepilin-type N-terminal cleavage/methylation domain-containing protein [Cerasicoccus sp. TK19100]
MKQCKKNYPGFTLIELLTVVAIIGILAAMLIPAIGHVRAKARAAQGVSNLRSMGGSFMAFANDHKGFLPQPTIKKDDWNELYPDNPVGGDQMWTKQLRDYLPQQSRSLTGREHEIFVCPNAEFANADGQVYDQDDLSRTYTATETLYGLNASGTPQADTARALATIENHSSAMLVIDAKSYNGASGSLSSTLWKYASRDQGKSAKNTTYIDFRQPGDNANVLFVDGHVEQISVDEFADLKERTWTGRIN